MGELVEWCPSADPAHTIIHSKLQINEDEPRVSSTVKVGRNRRCCNFRFLFLSYLLKEPSTLIKFGWFYEGKGEKEDMIYLKPKVHS